MRSFRKRIIARPNGEIGIFLLGRHHTVRAPRPGLIFFRSFTCWRGRSLGRSGFLRRCGSGFGSRSDNGFRSGSGFHRSCGCWLRCVGRSVRWRIRRSWSLDREFLTEGLGNDGFLWRFNSHRLGFRLWRQYALMLVLVADQNCQDQAENEKHRAKVDRAALENVRRARTEDLIRHATTECGTEAFLFRTLHQDQQSHQKADDHEDHQKEIDADI